MGRVLQHRRSRAAVAVETPVRCAIYTRKSTDEGLDSGFNTLDNQRQRAEAYIESQNWTPITARYDDGGFSGGNTERPALKRLLADVDAGLVDSIAVYRLDRLSRSLADFVQIHKYLDDQGVALVSVTESINTQTPHGRMMVNVLLSFAQYERELAAERTSHKIQASRRKGRWTGGHPPLGYDTAPDGGRLIENKDEAKIVLAIFEVYVEIPSLVKVAAELNRRGWRKKSWITKAGKPCGGGKWDRTSVRRLLTDPLVIGKQKLGDEIFDGEHKAIVPKKLWDKVHRLLQKNRRDRGATARNRYGFLLRGLLHCSACGRAMTPCPANRGTKLYRYYRCQAAQKHGADSCPTKSINADQVETFVIDQIRRIGSDPQLQDETFRQAVAQVRAQRRGLKAERKRIERDLVGVRAEVSRLVDAVTQTTGPAGEAIVGKLEEAQTRVATLESRQGEIDNELDALDRQDVDRDELARALAEFTPVWDVLLIPERERILQLLIERMDLNRETGEMKIAWRLDGFGELADEVSG